MTTSLFLNLATGASSREHELMEALQVLLERLNSGKIPLSPEMLQQAGLGLAGGAIGAGAVSGKGAAVDILLKRQNNERIQLNNDLRGKEETEIDGLLTEHVSTVCHYTVALVKGTVSS